MVFYLHPGNEGFQTARNSKFVDKTGIIAGINARINSFDKLMSVSRPRRFGKSVVAQMLCAYYDAGCDSAKLFDDMKIAEDDSYKKTFESIQRHLSGHSGDADIIRGCG